MDYYKDLAEMYVGDDVSPDFYGWVFPKYDHVAVGTGGWGWVPAASCWAGLRWAKARLASVLACSPALCAPWPGATLVCVLCCLRALARRPCFP